jgi:hypothetical protein
MTGQTDLRAILATMEPSLSETEFAFGTAADPAAAGTIEGVIATFAEEEGLSVIAPAQALAGKEIAHSPGWAKISLTIHSSLAAVGLTAALASALADQGISANVVAAYYHDHLFVPWEERHRAMDILASLAERSVLQE